ncbi:MAG: hypothetical protein NTU98_08990 [Bacteroidetes bacterium]|nr:hypothetical protein [Bacteroidota bacterium]
MKKICVLAVLIYLGSAGLMAQVSINKTGLPPASNAMLDVSADNMGMYIPRVQLTGTNDITTILGPEQGMIVFNIGAAGIDPNGVLEGLYYWSAASGGKWVSITSSYNSFESSSNAGLVNFEDFIFDKYEGASSNDNQYSFSRTADGGYSDVEGQGSIPFVGGSDYQGRHVLSTATSSNGAGGLYSYGYYNRTMVGSNQLTYEVRVKLDGLSNGTNTFTTYFGLIDGVASSGTVTPMSAIPDGIYFTSSADGLNWVGVTIKTNTATSTIVAPMAANQWVSLRATFNPANLPANPSPWVEFSVNGTNKKYVTTNIPTNTAMKFGFAIQKSKGTTARTASIDYFYCIMNGR